MSEPYITPEWMLGTPEARALYDGYAADAPIVDYHTHLSAPDILRDRRFETIADAWLETDHYKWRAMRACGVPEDRITGAAPPREKFDAWARTVPQLLGNPLYPWTHLELKRYFDCDQLLGPDTADAVWTECNARLPEMSVRDMMRRMDVRVVCTTDDPADPLDDHRAIAKDPDIAVRVYPTWRPDRALDVADPAAFNAWADRLAETADASVADFDAFWSALTARHTAFHGAGCRLSDYGVETIPDATGNLDDAAPLFARVRNGEPLSPAEVALWRGALFHAFATMDADRGWIRQLHIGPLRNNRTKLLETVGRDAGADSMGDARHAGPLNRHFDRLDREGRLGKTIVYNINPNDNAPVMTALGNFEDGSVAGKMQLGTAWWFLDNEDGIEAQLRTVARLGVLSRFVGMLTDSRSFLSFPRHEYFRRILCRSLGAEMRAGALPSDLDLVGGMVRGICYDNAHAYFGFDT